MEKNVKKNNVVRNIAIGVAVGAAVTMLKKSNREKVAQNVRNVKTKVDEIRQNPAPLKARVKETVQAVSENGKGVAALGMVKEKVNELQKLTPIVVETLKETRDIFTEKKRTLREKREITEGIEIKSESVVEENAGMEEARELMLQIPEEETEEIMLEKSAELKNETLVVAQNEAEEKKETKQSV
ncbi:hypothetical protein P6P90_14225 [Ectobacillus antri]|jgi:hypothetical protein|uniref:DUF4075 domain-containing protein n=1 Tax=Ectobacillus antri TaxID=2486280 RepID=A0ABT6H6Y6_9BACI|nr:hypothetical protein [Ectobacillus antri]MDG4658008.1 hypothetical protein [Ectobacillus antri]MDG5755102.1 hypothetical protein [Ectobacillus antri]